MGVTMRDLLGNRDLNFKGRRISTEVFCFSYVTYLIFKNLAEGSKSVFVYLNQNRYTKYGNKVILLKIFADYIR